MGHHIIIAGGSTGIGLETAKLLHRRGDHLYYAGRNHEAMESLTEAMFPPFFAEGGTPPVDLPEVIDGAVYFPGTITLKPFTGIKDGDFLSDFEVNLLGAVRFLRAILPSLKRSGSASVVLFSTVAVQTGLPYHASIAAAKGAIEGLTRSLAAEWAPEIRVNAIAPSLTDTPLASRLLDSDQKRESAGARHPLKRVGDPADLAELVALLIGDASRFMTGQILTVDGGMSSVRTF